MEYIITSFVVEIIFKLMMLLTYFFHTQRLFIVRIRTYQMEVTGMELEIRLSRKQLLPRNNRSRRQLDQYLIHVLINDVKKQ